jgi:hypothetical protein
MLLSTQAGRHWLIPLLAYLFLHPKFEDVTTL